MYYRTIQYHCPYCNKQTYLFSWKPAMTRDWRCRKCGRTMLLDAQGVGGVWAGSIGLWSIPIVWLLTAVVFAVGSLFGDRRELPAMILGGIICAGPMFALAGFFVFALVGYAIGYFYGLRLEREGGARKRRRVSKS